MERLRADERRKLWSYVAEAKMDNQSLMEERECAYYSGAMDAGEVLMRKYRMITCIAILNHFGYAGLVQGLDLMDAEEIFNYYDPSEQDREYNDCWQEYLIGLLAEMNDFGMSYLSGCLKETGWSVYCISELQEYEALSPEVIEKCRSAINFHWSALNEYYDEELHSEYLEKLGCTPDGYYTFYADCNVILTNENIRNMLIICDKEKHYREWPEYIELKRVKSFVLFDRYFPDISNENLDEQEWVCVSYLLGEVVTDKLEEAGFYQLNYEAVILLILADQIACDFMERYHKEQEGREKIGKRKAS